MANPLPTAGSTLSPHLPPLLFSGRCYPPLSSPLISAASCSPRCQQRRCPSLPPLLHSATASATPNADADAAASSTRCRSHFQPTFFTAALFLCLLPQLCLLLDIGSHLTWVSCTSSYQCRSCSSPSAAPIIPFLPKSSSSTRLVSCGSIPGTASPAAPPATPPPPTAALPSPAHLTPSSMAPAPLPVSSCWKHSPSPTGPSPTSLSVAPSFPNTSRLASLDSAGRSLPPVTDGAQVLLLLTPLPRDPLPRPPIYCDQQCRRRRTPLPPLSRATTTQQQPT
ncbi:hypothetical protein GW17_00005135 [Ensete ventricosum]|nr:hypothetical protein GW17_00005135 [Ensete ventricosum]